PTTAAADDGWNPFAEHDRRAARERRRKQAEPTSQAPYLAPMTEIPAQPYASPQRAYQGANQGDSQSGYQPYPYQPRYGDEPPPLSHPSTQPTLPANRYGASGQPPSYGGPQPAPAPFGAPATYAAPPPVTSPPSGFAEPVVERGNLTPVISFDGALPAGTWQGLDAAGAEQLLAPVRLPPASPAMAALFDRIMAEPIGDDRLDAVRLAALLKAGRFDKAGRLEASTNPAAAADPVQDVLQARLDLAAGDTGLGCGRIKNAVAQQAKLPGAMRGEAIVSAGYCAIVAGNRKAGGLAAELARDAGYNRPFTLALLEAIASGDRLRAPLPSEVTVLDGLLVGKLNTPDTALVDGMLARATAGFLQLVSRDDKMPAALRLKAAECGAAMNIIEPSALAAAYRAAAVGRAGDAGPSGERARQFAAAEGQQAQFAKTRAIRSLLDSAKGDGLFHPVAVAAAPIVRNIRPAQEISWFTETAVETLAAASDYRGARVWLRSLDTAGGAYEALDHWLVLLDIADPEVSDNNRGRSISVLENLALQGRFSQDALHRLATVLDALDYNVPIPLWDLASRSSQPQAGHLPETGILTAMKQASEAGQVASTALYALRTIAPEGTTATHLLGLGETIRALKRAGLEKDARRIGFEVLFADWPRTGAR
ncbi:MAG: hypothetical protein KKH72_05710, partial [Alphaproteobacteria bacterium]|nr:hypothetical protein [Alphaproteobacteria bacterium]